MLALVAMFVLAGVTQSAEVRKAAKSRSSGEAEWIWSPEQADGKVSPASACWFRKSFEITNPEEGSVIVACDDRYELFVNGRQAGAGQDWRTMDTYDISELLVSGRNVVSIKGENIRGTTAGLVARVTVKRAGDTTVAHSTDATWKTSLVEEPGWQRITFNDAKWAAAHSFGEFGSTAPWDNEVTASNGSGGRFLLPKQFRVERIVQPDEAGALISMAFNEWGDILASRENGPLVIIRDEDQDSVPETLSVYCDKVKNCHGILPLNGNVFVVGTGPEGAGVYRLSDSDQNGDVDDVKKILAFKGEIGEHGPHGLVLGPDGLLYIMVGNFTHVETGVSPTSPLKDYYEGDLVQPRYEDAGGHDVGIKAPGGTVIRTDLEGSFAEMYCCGLRNAFDLAFNRDGELFTYDSDMEWDFGLPWYRPVRLNHLIPGSESGWRSGWAKWPDYYLDNLPAVMDTGRGSPTGMIFYNHTKFPKRYQGCLFAADWSQGRIVALRFEQAGGSYVCGGEAFLQGRPLNVTDVAVGPDGWLYFTTGGRDTEGGVYRVIYSGKLPQEIEPEGILRAVRQPQFESAWAREAIATIKEELGIEWAPDLLRVASDASGLPEDRTRALDMMQLFGPSPKVPMLVKLASDTSPPVRAKAVELLGMHVDTANGEELTALLGDKDPLVRRKACEALVRAGMDAPVEKILPILADEDRFVAWAARRALEASPPSQWREQVLAAKKPRAFLNGAVALLTVDPTPEDARAILSRCGELMQGYLDDEAFLDLLRVMQLAYYRGELPADALPEINTMVAEEYPSLEPRINRELIRLLANMKDTSATDRLLEELRGKSALPERLHLALYSRFLAANWTMQQKMELLRFYETARTTEGAGYSYSLYVANFTKDVVADLNEEEQTEVLNQALKMPTAALNVLSRLPEKPTPEVLNYLIEIDRRLKALDTEASKQLQIGIVAILGASKHRDAMTYLRELFETQPERRHVVAMGLAQSPGGENWPLLLRSLPIVENRGIPEVLVNLAKVDLKPDNPEPIRQVILAGLKLKEKEMPIAIKLLKKWTGAVVDFPTPSETPLTPWQRWFSEEYPDALEAKLPEDTADSRWTQAELTKYLIGKDALAGNAVNGAKMFEKAQCAKCHKFGGKGEGAGPDLTTISRRFQTKEILESVLFPSQVVSDQYATKSVETTKGETIVGLVSPAGADAIVVLQSNAEKVTIAKEDISEIMPIKKSAMPEGLFNSLTVEEIADLFEYLQSTPSSDTARRTR
ncbi:MAG: HEAT repeat domain-containing protein [Pirellulales bacterium]